jgi:hypothetical protein
MTNEEINRAIAESVGWKCQSHVREQDRASAVMCWIRPGKEDWQAEQIPDYCNSYDAIMPLVKALKKGRENHFADKLIDTVHPDVFIYDNYIHTAYCHALITATPRQLCEAYLAVGGADA